MIDCKLEIGEQEIEAMVKLQFLRYRKDSKRLTVTKVLYMLLFGISIYMIYWSRGSILFQVIFALLALVCLYMAMAGMKKLLMRNIRKATRKAGAKTNDNVRYYTFADDFIEIKTDASNGKFEWKAIESCGKVDGYLYLIRNDNTMLLVDERKLSEEERKRLRDLILNKLDINLEEAGEK